MNWNIEQLSWNKIQLPGMADAIARVVVGSDVDILVIVEVKTVNLDGIMTTLRDAINHRRPALTPAYYWLSSMTTGGEHYGFIVRDINAIRPLRFAINPNAPIPIQKDGTADEPFTDLHALNWTTWPVAFPAAAPHVVPPRPRMGLINTFATPRAERPTKIQKTNFAGQVFNAGGYAQGRGYRMPCLAMFVVRGPGGALTYLPIVVCHYASVRGGRNFLAQKQISQLNQLHIAQLFSFYDTTAHPLLPPECGFLAIDGAAVAVRNIIYTGDFNVDFLQNHPGGGNVPSTNHDALSSLTPTLQTGGSANPAAAAGAVPGVAPVVPFNAPFPPAPDVDEIPFQDLRASSTTEGTILNKVGLIPPPMPPLKPLTLPPPPANTLVIRGGAIDNFFYGGAEANTAIINFGVNNVDSGEVIDVPAHIQQHGAGGAPPNLSVNGLQAHYAATGKKRGHYAPNLAGAHGVAPPLDVNDRWIGARMISDHLPVVIEIVCP
jgi:hypothetical protein